MDTETRNLILLLGEQERGTHIHIWEDGECAAVLRKNSIVEWTNVSSGWVMRSDGIAEAIIRVKATWTLT